jgi:hypothetical protein
MSLAHDGVASVRAMVAIPRSAESGESIIPDEVSGAI